MPIQRWLRHLTSLSALSVSLCAFSAAASDFPQRTIRMLVPFGAGGITDIVARATAEQLGKELGQIVIVENRPGAGGNLAAEALARAPADGYTLMMTTVALLSVNPHVYKSVPFDPFTSFSYVGMVASTPHAIVVSGSQPAATLKDLVDEARRQPEALAFASAGMGSSPHQGLEILQRSTQTRFLHVPYKSGSESVTALLGAQAAVTFEAMPVVAPHVKSGRLRVLALAARERHALEPEWPTTAQAGFPALLSGSTSGLIAPAGTPPQVMARLSEALSKALASPQLKGRLHAQGSTALGSDSAEFVALVRSEHARWGTIFKSGN